MLGHFMTRFEPKPCVLGRDIKSSVHSSKDMESMTPEV